MVRIRGSRASSEPNRLCRTLYTLLPASAHLRSVEEGNKKYILLVGDEHEEEEEARHGPTQAESSLG